MATLAAAGHESSGSAIGRLSRDILGIIFEYIYQTSPWTIGSLVEVNSVFYSSAYPLKYRHQNFIFHGDMQDQRSKRSHDALKSFLVDPARKHILESVRSITVKSEPRPSNWLEYSGDAWQAHQNKWLLFAQLLSKMPTVKTMTLQGTDQLPVAVLEALQEYHPFAHLHIENWTRIANAEDHNNADELALARCPNLRSVQAQMGWNDTHGLHQRDFRKAALQRIVALAPNLRVLDITPGRGQNANNSHGVREFEEASAEDKKLSALFLEDVSWTANSLRSLFTYGQELIMSLKNVMNLAELESFGTSEEVDFADFLEIAEKGQQFSALKHLSLSLTSMNYRPVTTQFEKILTEYCASLESICILNGAFRTPLPTILSHASTLRKLVMHSEEVVGRVGTSSTAMSLQNVLKISQTCEILEDITIDVESFSSTGHFKDILSALSRLPFLHTIRIYHPLGIADEAARTPYVILDADESRVDIETYRVNPRNPIKDASWLENAWSFLRHMKKHHGSVPLEELHVKIGEWERELSDGDHAGWAIFEAANRRYYVATPHERDDRPEDLNVSIKGSKPYSRVDLHEIRRIPDFREASGL